MYLHDLISKAKGITSDSRCVKPGYIFVAIKGWLTNGLLYAPEAIAKGALAVVTDQQPDRQLPVPVISVPDARKALAELSACFFNHPSHHLSLVGVTGTNGKTTTAAMLEHIFCIAGYKTGFIGTVKVNDGRTCHPPTLTTPDAATTQKHLADMVANGVTHAAMEVSAQGMEMGRTDFIKFACGILTNISPDHLDFHGSFDNYLCAKTKFVNLLSPESPLIVNIDDYYCRHIKIPDYIKTISVSLVRPADLYASCLETSAWSSRYKLTLTAPLDTRNGLTIRPATWQFTLNIPGSHNIANAVMATAAALFLNIPPDIVIKALASFKPVERRMEIFRQKNYTILDDTALNPGSINAVFDVLTQFNSNPIVINAIRGNRGVQINVANAAALAYRQRLNPFKLIITASEDYADSQNKVSENEKKEFLATLNKLRADYIYSDSLPESLKMALSLSSSNSLIALIGAQGMDAGRQILLRMLENQRCSPIIPQRQEQQCAGTI